MRRATAKRGNPNSLSWSGWTAVNSAYVVRAYGAVNGRPHRDPPLGAHQPRAYERQRRLTLVGCDEREVVRQRGRRDPEIVAGPPTGAGAELAVAGCDVAVDGQRRRLGEHGRQ